MRDSEQRLPRQAVLAAAAPFGFAGGTRITLPIDQLDGTIGQGIGRFRLAATTAADPLVGSEIPRALARRADRSQPTERSKARQKSWPRSSARRRRS